MKKLLILIIALACMGCGEECADLSTGHSGCEQSRPCDWGREFNECTCQCEWAF